MDSHLHASEELDCMQISHSVKCHMNELISQCPNVLCNKNSLIIVTQNIVSIYKNLDDLQANLSILNLEADILVLTECRLESNKQIPLLRNYTSYQTSKLLNQNDGVVVYICNKHRAKVTELLLSDASGLQVVIENLVLLCIYRSPSFLNSRNFVSSLDAHLETIKRYKHISILGDININLLPKDNERAEYRRNRHSYLNVLSLHGILPAHKLPTRKGSCLDHVMLKTDSQIHAASVAVVTTSITDHCTVLLNLRNISICKSKSKPNFITNFGESCNTLISTDLTYLEMCKNPEDYANNLISVIMSAIKENSKEIYFSNNKRILKPWITPGALRCIQLRNRMQQKFERDPHNSILKITYTRFRNFCSNLIKKLKRTYHREIINKTVNNPRKFWNTINKIAQYKAPKTNSVALLNLKTEPLDSVNYINDFFVNIGADLADVITNQAGRRSSGSVVTTPNLISSNPSSFILLDTDVREVESVLMNLDSGSSPGWDGITTAFLKHAREFVVPHICKLANLCFNTGVFPSSLKRSIVTPVYKSGDRADVNNYRPISVLTSISKIIEKILNSRLVSFLDKFKIISNSQYGFRKSLSTQDAILDLTTALVSEVDSGKKCLTVFLDLKKAFDTVSVPILVRRLENIGIRDIPLLLFKSYLQGRTQEVKIDGLHSEKANVCFGVPQGSVLGPTLFLIYINELCCLQGVGGRVFSYADDTAVVFTGDTWDAVLERTERGLRVMSEWLGDNLLTLNVQKTNYICFTPSMKSQPDSNFQIKIHNCSNPDNSACTCPPINKVTQTKYLGIVLDQRLSWQSHIELLMNRTRKLIWVFKSLRHVMTNTLLNKIYIALAQSVLTYCIPVWGGAAKSHVLGLEKAQRSLIKVMYFKPYRFPTDKLYRLSGLLSVRKLYVSRLLQTCHKSLTYVDISHKRRRDAVVPVPFTRTAFARRQYLSQSARIYNIVNKKLKIYPMLPFTCKRTITDWLYSLNYEEVENLLTRTS